MSRQTKTLLIIFGAIGGVFLLCGLGCGGLIFYWLSPNPFSSMPNVMTEVDIFLDALKTDQVHVAYGRTSRAFQTRQSFEQFRAFVAQYPALTEQTSRQYGGLNIVSGTGGTTATIEATVLTANNSLAFTLIFILEDGQWKLDQFTVP
jgi:hypothetical protein